MVFDREGASLLPPKQVMGSHSGERNENGDRAAFGLVAVRIGGWRPVGVLVSRTGAHLAALDNSDAANEADFEATMSHDTEPSNLAC